MLTDTIAPPEHALTSADLQRQQEQMQQQIALLSQALLHVIRGEWDAARFGPNSVEALLVAVNPALQGRVHPVPFDAGR